MKLFACILLVVLMLEEYQCKPRHRHHHRQHGHTLGHWHNHPVSSPYWHPSFGTHRLGHRPHYRLYPRHRSSPHHITPYSPTMHRGSYYYGLHHDTREYSTSFAAMHPHLYNGQQGRPQQGILYPTQFPSAQQTPNVIQNGAPNRGPYGTKNSIPNVMPVETLVGNEEVAVQSKLFFVTPNGIQETPAEPAT